MILLAFNWSSFLANLGQFILAFSILVTIHEFGHYITAKWFGCRVEKFYLFFNPWFSILRTKKINGKRQIRWFAANVPANHRNKLDENGKPELDEKGKPVLESIPLNELPNDDWRKYPDNIETGIGWVPFGGYVSISGMIDESMNKEAMKQPPKSWEFRSKPAWQRLIIMLAGIILNILLAFVIFAMMLFVWGEQKLPMQNVKYGFAFDSLAKSAGFVDGDKILSVNGEKIKYYGDFVKAIFFNEEKIVGIERNGKDTSIKLPSGFLSNLTKSKSTQLWMPRMPIVIKSDADVTYVNGKLMPGDTLIGVNDNYFKYFEEYIKAKEDLKNTTITLHVLRNGNDTVNVQVKTDENTATKFIPVDQNELLGIEKIKYNFWQSIPAGVRSANEKLVEYVEGLKLLFTSKEHKVKDNLGSVISIGKAFGGVWDWQRFWMMTAWFSVILAFMNVLPIPALDGGHALFAIIEMITGRKPSDKFMEYAQTVGMILLLGLMAYALGLDIFRLFR
jgi:regulator of sigma E protease